ncbi:MAG: ubiquitin-conjugating enzyme E2 [Candidatus Brocadiia bacterium]|jgi:ubiquitin-protein ligase
MSTMRLRRLKADYDKICTMFSGKSPIRVKEARGTPPEKYQIEFLVTSLQQDPMTHALRSHNCFIAEITLTAAYPRMAPQCRMITPAFHPNIAPHAICIGDHWAAGESLPFLIVRIAEMVAFQSYNVKSPLNGEAARWVEANKASVPTDTRDFSALLSVGEAVARSRDGAVVTSSECANCGKPAGAAPMKVCVNQHTTCDDCALECAVCKSVLCLKCPQERCALCGATACHRCLVRCNCCNRIACSKHAGPCHVCGLGTCAECLVRCDACGRLACVQHITKALVDGGRKYHCTACTGQAQQPHALS